MKNVMLAGLTVVLVGYVYAGEPPRAHRVNLWEPPRAARVAIVPPLRAQRANRCLAHDPEEVPSLASPAVSVDVLCIRCGEVIRENVMRDYVEIPRQDKGF